MSPSSTKNVDVREDGEGPCRFSPSRGVSDKPWDEIVVVVPQCKDRKDVEINNSKVEIQSARESAKTGAWSPWAEGGG